MSSPTPVDRIRLLTTGGTIAGVGANAGDASTYSAGCLNADGLLSALEAQRDRLPEIEARELFSIDSKDMTPAHWITLARAVVTARERADIKGVVITHGTDTLEETAWFLQLVCPPGKPIVLTAAMRPATALSADGPMNLYQAIRVANLATAAKRGVLVVMNDHILSASDVAKTHARALSAIEAPGFGPVGNAADLTFHRSLPLSGAGIVELSRLGESLPPVEILYVAAGSDPSLLSGTCARGCAGVVLALPGNGSLPDRWRDAALEAMAQGLRVIRASRTGRGTVSLNPASALPASGVLNPLQTRIALMLELATGQNGLVARLASEAA